MKYLVIIPAYNVAGRIKLVIEAIRKYTDDIIVVDDGSADGITDMLMLEHIPFISHDKNKGKGAALKSGFAYAIENQYEAVITLDGDGQHNPKYIPDFLDMYQSSRADLIIGSRAGDKADMPWDRRFSNFLTSGILTLLLGRKIEDSQSGFRLINTALLKQIKLVSNRFELETEIIIKAVQQGFMLRFVPIRVVYGRKIRSSIHRLNDTLRWIMMVMEQL